MAPSPNDDKKKNTLVALLGRRDTPTDGVADYCGFLATALESREIQVSLARVSWMEDGWLGGLRKLWRESIEWRGQWVLLQYTALSWSRRGFPFGALAALAILRRRGVRCAVVFHEPNRQGGSNLLQSGRGACQDWVIRKLYDRASKSIFTVPLETVAWLPAGEDKAAFIPIGANIPERVYRRAGPAQAGKVKTVIVFGVSDSREAAAPEVNVISDVMLEASGKLGRLRLVVLGRGAVESRELLAKAFHRSDVDLEVRGVLPAEQVADEFESADALLFVRGPVTLRRGSALAAVASGIPIVGYRGEAFSGPLERLGVEWCTWQDHESLTRGLIRVLSDSQRWTELHERNLEVQRNYLSWNRIAERFQAILAP